MLADVVAVIGTRTSCSERSTDEHVCVEETLQHPGRVLLEHTRARSTTGSRSFPPGPQRSAVIAALRFAQAQNNGFLTPN
jgi:hypothetical protein